MRLRLAASKQVPAAVDSLTFNVDSKAIWILDSGYEEFDSLLYR
jgi:hypothetical protein